MRPYMVNKPASFAARQQPELDEINPSPVLALLQQVMPWAVAIGALVALIILLSNGDRRLGTESVPEMRKIESEDVEQRLRAEVEVERRVSDVDRRLTEKLQSLASTSRRTSTRNGEASDNVSIPKSFAGINSELETLRTYVKDVANSVALLDSEVSDPAVLQRKLEHQKAIAQR